MKRPEKIRKEIMLQLYACRPLALSADRIGRDALKQGYDFTPSEIAREIQFLIDEGVALDFIVKGATERLCRISSEGIRQYEQTYAL